jgi:hypothetical protein
MASLILVLNDGYSKLHPYKQKPSHIAGRFFCFTHQKNQPLATPKWNSGMSNLYESWDTLLLRSRLSLTCKIIIYWPSCYRLAYIEDIFWKKEDNKIWAQVDPRSWIQQWVQNSLTSKVGHRRSMTLCEYASHVLHPPSIPAHQFGWFLFRPLNTFPLLNIFSFNWN